MPNEKYFASAFQAALPDPVRDLTTIRELPGLIRSFHQAKNGRPSQLKLERSAPTVRQVRRAPHLRQSQMLSTNDQAKEKYDQIRINSRLSAAVGRL